MSLSFLNRLAIEFLLMSGLPQLNVDRTSRHLRRDAKETTPRAKLGQDQLLLEITRDVKNAGDRDFPTNPLSNVQISKYAINPDFGLWSDEYG